MPRIDKRSQRDRNCRGLGNGSFERRSPHALRRPEGRRFEPLCLAGVSLPKSPHSAARRPRSAWTPRHGNMSMHVLQVDAPGGRARRPGHRSISSASRRFDQNPEGLEGSTERSGIDGLTFLNMIIRICANIPISTVATARRGGVLFFHLRKAFSASAFPQIHG